MGVIYGEVIDISRPIWDIPAARMKLKKYRKGNPANDHIISLSPAAVQLLGRARKAAGGSAFFFPRRSEPPCRSEKIAILDAHAAAGLAGRHSPHGWRAAFSTILVERRREDRAAIDLALAHSPKDKVEAEYNRAEHFKVRRSMFDEWGQILSGAPIAAWRQGTVPQRPIQHGAASNFTDR